MMDVLADSLCCAQERLEQGILKIDLLLAELHVHSAAIPNDGPFALDGPWRRQLVQQREILAKTLEFIENLLANARRQNGD